MKIRFNSICVVIFLLVGLCLKLFAQTSHSSNPFSLLFRKEIKFPVQNSKLTYALPDSFIVPGSQTVWLDSVEMKPDINYKFDFIAGMIFFQQRLSKAKQIRLSYDLFPFTLKQKYRHRSPVRENNSRSSQKLHANRSSKIYKPNPLTQNIIPSRLRKSGSIIRGLSVGTNQNLQVNSGLRLQLSGQLTQNVEIVASLTDQNTPIQPEGNTQTLQEIDKVFIQLKGPHLQATFGDFILKLPDHEFTRYNRKLEGIMGRGKYDHVNFTVSGAVSRGQFATNEFQGKEGNQGPYQLTGKNGEVNILVLSGTERVWIDGEQMTRGENNDYIIEYGNGQITFTRKRLITADSRIVVDFQFSDESFQRNYWAVQAESQVWKNKIRLGTTFIRESDDKNNPLTLSLSDDLLTALENAGDGQPIVPGSKFVGADSGNYVMEGPGIFKFVGTKQGDYTVTFSFFGANKGDYRNIGLGRFEYVGENQGSYRPFILLPKAQRHDMVGFNVGISPGAGLTVNSEFAISQFDQNTYSSRDDGNNTGNAYSIKFDFKPENVSLGKLKLGEFSLTGKLRRKQPNFRDIDRTTIAEFNRKWNLENPKLTTEESIQEFAGKYRPVSGLIFKSGFGHLRKAAVFNSNRWEAQTILSRKKLPKMNYFVEFIDRNDKLVQQKSTWLRQRGQAHYQLGFLKPNFSYEGEVKKDVPADTTETGFRFDSYTPGLEAHLWKPLFLSARYNVRDDKQRVAGGFRPKSIAKTQTYSLDLKRWHAFNISAAFTHRNRAFSDSSSRDIRSDLADIRIGYTPRNGGVKGNVNYQISNTQIASQEEVFIEVEEGQGNFRFNEMRNEFEPDPFGNFVKRLFSTKNFTPVVELRFRTALRFSAQKLFWRRQKNSGKKSFLQKIAAPVSTETFLRIDERTREKDVAKIYLLQLSHFQQDSTTVFGNMELRQDVYLWENSRQLSFRYRFRSRSELNNQLVDGGQDRDVREHKFRFLHRLTNRITSQVEFTHSSEDKLFKSASREDRRIRSNDVQLDLVFRPRPRMELGLKGQFSRNKDIAKSPATRADLFSFAPRANYSLSNKGRLRSELQWTYVSTSPKTVLIPFELTNGNRSGTTLRWNVGLDYRLSQNVQASFTYFGRSEPDRPKTQHIARVEMRAFF